MVLQTLPFADGRMFPRVYFHRIVFGFKVAQQWSFPLWTFQWLVRWSGCWWCLMEEIVHVLICMVNSQRGDVLCWEENSRFDMFQLYARWSGSAYLFFLSCEIGPRNELVLLIVLRVSYRITCLVGVRWTCDVYILRWHCFDSFRVKRKETHYSDSCALWKNSNWQVTSIV